MLLSKLDPLPTSMTTILVSPADSFTKDEKYHLHHGFVFKSKKCLKLTREHDELSLLGMCKAIASDCFAYHLKDGMRHSDMERAGKVRRSYARCAFSFFRNWRFTLRAFPDTSIGFFSLAFLPFLS